jgi:hypothetical protein
VVRRFVTFWKFRGQSFVVRSFVVRRDWNSEWSFVVRSFVVRRDWNSEWQGDRKVPVPSDHKADHKAF